MSRRRHTPADEPHFLVRTLAADFADGDAVAPHAHSWGQLIYAAAGVVTVWTEQGVWVVPPYWAIWAPAGVEHSLRFTGSASLRTLYVRPDISVASRSTVVTVSPLLRELILRAVRERMLDARDRLHRALVDLIVHECSPSSVPPLELSLPYSDRLRRVAEHLASRSSERVSHATLARRFGVGARTLERGFVAETGLSLGQWRRQARFMEALRQLGAGSSVKRAAMEAGYRTPSAFVAAFRSSFKITPARYFRRGPQFGSSPGKAGA
jgi:AraC-like DNA-binding protein/quercetin dioxygenase-like cupin family protein